MFRQCSGQRLEPVEHGTGEQQDRRDHRDDLAHIAQVDAEGREDPHGAERNQRQRQQDHGQPQGRRRRQPLGEEVEQEPDAKPDQEVEQRAAQADHRQEVEREHDLLHQVRIGHDQGRRPRQGLGQKAVEEQPDEDDQRERSATLTGRSPPGREHLGEEHGVDPQHQQRRERHPEQPAGRAAVTRERVALGHLPDEIAMKPEVADESRRGEWKARRHRGGVSVDRTATRAQAARGNLPALSECGVHRGARTMIPTERGSQQGTRGGAIRSSGKQNAPLG